MVTRKHISLTQRKPNNLTFWNEHLSVSPYAYRLLKTARFFLPAVYKYYSYTDLFWDDGEYFQQESPMLIVSTEPKECTIDSI